MLFPYFISDGDYATVYIDGKPLSVASSHPNFDEIVAHLTGDSHDKDTIRRLSDMVTAIGFARPESVTEEHSDIVFDPVTGVAKFKGFEIGGDIVDRIFTLLNSGKKQPAKVLITFLNNLYNNPSSGVIKRLYTFLEKGKMPITEDGHFLAYKKVRSNYKDVHTGTMDNSVGQVREMPRALVDDNDNQTCSSGLHFCSYEYLGHFSGERVMVLKINPADVVSIPTDYNDTKGRCCRYEVIDEITEAAKQGPVWDSTVTPIVDSLARDNQPVNPIVAHYKAVESQSLVDTNTLWPQPAINPGSTQSNKTPPIVDQLSNLSNRELAILWNAISPTKIDHFRDKATGIRRLLSLGEQTLRQYAPRCSILLT